VDLERIARQKDAAGLAAARLVEDGMLVGLGSGSTSARFIIHLAERRLDIRGVPTSPAVEDLARSLGIAVEPYDTLPRLGALDMAVDGADQVAPDGWIVKGGGGAHRRERVVAEAARRFIVIVDSTKVVDAIGPPIPLELDAGAVESVMDALAALGAATIREGWPPSPDGGVIADYTGPVEDPASIAQQLESIPGVLAHGLFGPRPGREVIVGRDDGSEPPEGS
jgi:ribose 5-phosphate isomerase A